MKECSVCFEGYKNGVKCFGKCSLEICLSCFNKILNINEVQDICMICPQCRHLSVKGLDNKFSKYVSNNKKCLKRIVFLLENHIDNESKRMLENTWEAFNTRVNEQIWLQLTPDQLADITYAES